MNLFREGHVFYEMLITHNIYTDPKIQFLGVLYVFFHVLVLQIDIFIIYLVCEHSNCLLSFIY